MYQFLNIGSGSRSLALGPLCIAPVLAYLPLLGQVAVVVGDGQLAGEHQVEYPAGASNLIGSAETTTFVSSTTLSGLTA